MEPDRLFEKVLNDALKTLRGSLNNLHHTSRDEIIARYGVPANYPDAPIDEIPESEPDGQ
ncbi:MAG: hypothetical protein O8C61_03235 [Candidatus Methanoperedens sp.]|nr:hypothetical protein [Candidatus Methanoperedens sp.]